MSRVVCWFSAGAASAVATKLTLVKHPDAVVVRCDPGSEHEDNARFADDCAEWFGKPIEVLRSTEYTDTWDVWARRRYIVGHHGAPCTLELKKRLRQQFERPGDVQVFGYHAGEQHRVDGFRRANPDVRLSTPLIDAWLTKADCLAIVERAGIELPAMYRLGFPNANCIGCPHGGMGYWNRTRTVFPETFDRMARLERELGHAVNKDDDGPVFLDELDPDRGKDDIGVEGECSLLCVAAEMEMAK